MITGCEYNITLIHTYIPVYPHTNTNFKTFYFFMHDNMSWFISYHTTKKYIFRLLSNISFNLHIKARLARFPLHIFANAMLMSSSRLVGWVVDWIF